MSEPTPYEIVAPQMRSLQKLDTSLQRLDIRWEVIDTTARIVCPADAADFLHTLDKTRHAFATLADEMVEHIARTHLGNRINDLGAKAQIAIDILVRNLFERTADVGFIATDLPLVEFVQAHAQSGKLVSAEALRNRLKEYRAKYTVYEDILLLDDNAQPLLDLAGHFNGQALLPYTEQQVAPTAAMVPPAWWRSMLQKDGYVESYEESAWFAGAGPQLLYAHRIVGSNKQPCGAVVLRFGLADELRSIFADLLNPTDKVIVGLVDAQGVVLASSLPATLMPGSRWESSHGAADANTEDTAAHAIVQFQGIDYLVAGRTTRGYQGYSGLPWQAIALVRLDSAFRTNIVQNSAADAPTKGLDTEDPLLNAVVARASAIEDDLTQVIWNGKMAESALATGSSVNAVFDQIGRTGKDTIALFDHAIADLRLLFMAGRDAELHAHARLAVTIMDRNLYERANDCRWWALSHELATILDTLRTATTASEAQAAEQRAGTILAHLNSLYTVYRRVALFDRDGRVLAVSRDADTLPSPMRLDADLVRRTLALKGSQAYAVSPMQPQALADDHAAYVYCAAIRLSPGGPVLGGIALAFDCANELNAMLRDALPAAGDTLGFFTDPHGRVLATTAPDAAVGDKLEFVSALQRANEVSHQSGNHAHPIRWKGRDFMAVTASSSGYREFKRTDDYRETVFSVLLMPVQSATASSGIPALPTPPTLPGASARRYGIVQCGSLLLAIEAKHVQKAQSAQALLRVPGTGQLAGLLQVIQAGKGTMAPAYDANLLIGQAPLKDPKTAVAVVVASQQRTMVLLVEKLFSVVSFDTMYPVPPSVAASAPWITGILGNSAGQNMVYVLNPDGFDAKQLPMPPDLLSGTAPDHTEDGVDAAA